MNNKDKHINNFRLQALESLQYVEERLLLLEDGSEEALNTVFRALRSIKGGAKFLNFISVSRLAHQLECILVLIRKGELKASKNISRLLLKGRDALDAMIQSEDGGENYDVSAIFEEATHIIEHEKVLTSKGIAQNNFQNDLQNITAQLLNTSQDHNENNPKPFGQFLIEQGHLSSEQVFTALIEQEKQALIDLQVFTDLGVSISNCLNIANVARVHMLHPLRVARDLAYINTEDVEKLNKKILSSRPQIGRILHDLHYCDNVEIRLWLQEYYAYCNGIEPEESIQKQLANHRQLKTKQVPEKFIPAPEQVITEAIPKEPAQRETSTITGSTIECDASLLNDFKEYATDDLHDNIEFLIIGLESPANGDEKLESIQVLFRLMHSLKGSVGFIGAEASKTIIHQIEDVLALIQRAPASIDSAQWKNIVSVFLTGVDIFRGLRNAIIDERNEKNFIAYNPLKINAFVNDITLLKERINETIKESLKNEDIDDMF